MTIWDPRNETMPREDLDQLQLERLQTTLNRVHRSVAFYHGRFGEQGFDPGDFRSLDDLRRLPFTTRAELAQHHPYGLFAVPLREVVRLHAASTATGGRQVVVGHTARDIRTWGELVARVLVAGGVTRDDVVQIAFDYGIFPDGFGFHYGAERIGASVIPTSAARMAHQLEIMRDYRSTVLIAPPSVARSLADHLVTESIDPKSLFLRVGVFSAESWGEPLRRDLESRLTIRAADAYAVGEVMGPGVAGECAARAGLHLQEDHFLAEIVDPATGAVLPPGATGELVLTTLTREAFPLIRYRTGDLTSLDPTVVLLRSNARPHRPHRGTDRRHDQPARRAFLPRAGRRDPDRARGGCAPIRPGAPAGGRAGSSRDQGRGLRGDLLRRHAPSAADDRGGDPPRPGGARTRRAREARRSAADDPRRTGNPGCR